MIGVDANLIVRLLTNDDPKQAKSAAKLFEQETIFISKSVLLETEWVLRYSYELTSANIFQAFEKILGLSQVVIEDPQSVFQALEWYQQGFDFADALHLASCLKDIKKFMTFDKSFIKVAKKAHVPLVSLA